MNGKKKLLVAAAITTLIIAGLVGYISNKDQGNGQQGKEMTQSSSTNAVATDTVTIKGFAYEPSTITVKVGTTVTWTNQDTVEHTVTSEDDAAGLKSKLFGKGETYSHTFDTAGTFDYYCQPHPYMKGTVIVTE